MAEGFTRVPPKVHFADIDSRVLDFWDEIDAFAESIAHRPRYKADTGDD